MDIQQEIEILKKSSSWEKGKKHFNVFTTLLKNSDEVYLHSRFISTLLDPKGPLGLGTKPLKLFLEQIGSKYKEEVSDSTMVTPNASNWTEEGDIDILIEDTERNFAIIIENKIYSGDNNSDPQCGQLQKYFWQVQKAMLRQKGEGDRERANHHRYPKKRIEVYYLTPNRHPASSYSMSHGKKEEGFVDLTNRVKCIGYGEGQVITEWLKKLLKEDNCCEFAKEAIRQYLEVIKEIVGDVGLNKKLSDLVSALLDKNKEMKCEMLKELLGDRFIDVQWHAIASFMDNLGNELQQLKMEVEGRSLHTAITDLLYHPNKHTPIYFRIKQNGIVWTLQANDRSRERGFFLGIDNTTMPNIEKCSEIEELNLKENEYTNTEGWHAIKYLSESALKVNEKTENYPLLNLWDFTQGDTFDLLNEEKRQEIAEQYAAFVEQELNKIN